MLFPFTLLLPLLQSLKPVFKINYILHFTFSTLATKFYKNEVAEACCGIFLCSTGTCVTFPPNITKQIVCHTTEIF